MVQSVFPTAEQVRQANLVRTAYGTALCKLFKSDIDLTLFLTAADLAAVEADFVGYTPVTFTTVGPTFIDPAGGVSFDLESAFFQATNAVTPNDIYGGWVETAGGDLMVAWKLQGSYPMNVALAAMSLDQLVNMFGPRIFVLVLNGNPQ